MSATSHTSRLPTELCIEIIKIVIDDTLPIPAACTLEKFPEVLCTWRSTPMTCHRHRKLKNKSIYDPTTRLLRLVCRTWFDIVQGICKHRPSVLPVGHPGRYIAANGRLIASLPIFDEVADIEDQSSLIKSYPLQEDLHSFGRNVSTLLVSRLDLWRHCVPVDRDNLSLLVKHSGYFPNLRSLTLEDYCIPDSFWADMENGFPQLTSLQLSRCWIPSGTPFHRPQLNLPNLKIADFDIRGHLPKCAFPALTHLSLHWDSQQSNPYLQLLDDHFPQLESLIDRSFSNSSIMTQGVWDANSLLLLGARTSIIQAAMRSIMRYFSRTLTHVWILDSTDAIAETVGMILDSCKALTHLTVDTSHISSFSLHSIQIRCRKRGITLVEMAET